MRDNSLVCMSGRDGHYMGVDKNCEFNINFQKNYFSSKGIHGTWEQLGHLAPNIPIYRGLKRQFVAFMGAPWQGTTHTDVNTSELAFRVKRKAGELAIHLENTPNQPTVQNRTTGILTEGIETLRSTGVKAFTKRYKAWVKEGVPFEINEDGDSADFEEETGENVIDGD